MAVEIESVGSVLVEVQPLNGIDDFGEVKSWMTQMAGQIAAGVRAKGGDDSQCQCAIRNQVQKTLKVSPTGAREALKLAYKPTAQITPKSVLTDDGARQLAEAGKRAQLAARLAHDEANKLEALIAKLNAQAKRQPAQRTQLIDQAQTMTRDLLAKRAHAQRAAVVAGSTIAALKFRQKAKKTPDPVKQRELLGKAAAAVDAGIAVAQTKVLFDIPAAIAGKAPSTATHMPSVNWATGAVNMAQKVINTTQPQATASASPLDMSSSMAKALQSMHRLPASAGRPPFGIPAVPQFAPANAVRTTGQIRHPINLPTRPMPPARGPVMDFLVTDRQVNASLRGLGDFWSDAGNFLKGAAEAVIPAHTIVGKALRGDVGGAATDAIKLGAQQTGKIIQQNTPPPQLNQGQQEVANEIANGTNAVKPPGMSNPMAGLPGWAIPAGIGAVALVLGFILL